MSRLSGGCFCGDVRYTCDGPLPGLSSVCHCTTCRRTCGGGLGVAWITVPKSSFRVSGAALTTLASSARVVRQFCGKCGGHVTYCRTAGAGAGGAHGEAVDDDEDDNDNEIDVLVASLDDDAAAVDGVAPTHHIWMSDALPWDRPSDGLPQYPARAR